MTEAIIRGFTIRTDLAYHLDTHLWVEILAPDRVRLGMDPLGVETSGTLAQLAFVEPGTELQQGESCGSIEAEKFVGSLSTPLSGGVIARNEAVMRDPGLVERDPYGEGWFLELAPSALDEELSGLLIEPADIVTGFDHKVVEYRTQGVLAE